MKRKILVLEDEENIRSFLVLNLKRSGYEVIEAETGEIALEKYHENQDIAVAVLDVMLPGIDGYEVCRAMRGAGYQAGVIMLTARTQEADKVTGLMNGADDYVTKPFNPLELVARVKSQLRRYVRLGSIDGKAGQKASEQREGVYATGGLVVDDKQKIVSMDGQPVAVTPIEFGILCYLTRHAGRVFSIEQIYEAVWNEPAYNPENTVAVHIRRIREKIEIDPKNPRYLKVVWGIGYKMEKL